MASQASLFGTVYYRSGVHCDFHRKISDPELTAVANFSEQDVFIYGMVNLGLRS